MAGLAIERLREIAEPMGVRLALVSRLAGAYREQVDRLAAEASGVDGVSPFGEHKWLRLVRGDDRCAALLLWRGSDLAGAAHCDIYHTSEPDHPCRLTSEMVIHPAYRQRGYGRTLVLGTVALAEDECADEAHLWSYGNLESARMAASTACDWSPGRTLLQMQISGTRLPEGFSTPEGIVIRSFDLNRDCQAWLALHNRVFAGHPEQGNWDADDLQARLDQVWFSAHDLLLAERAEDGDLLGFCWVKQPLDPLAPGEIYIVGVDPTAQGFGLGRTLMDAGLSRIRRVGRSGAELYVEATNNTAQRLYDRMGFQTRWQHVCWRRPLTGKMSRRQDTVGSNWMGHSA